jgi:photosystem II stability/assembly factor-like uncharacterized protein
MNDNETTTRMRRGMTAEADRAPQADNVIARIVAAGSEPTVRESRARRSRAWLAPTLAAAGVATVVVSVIAITKANTGTPRPQGVSSIAEPAAPIGPTGSPLPDGFRPVDVSLLGDGEGWALGSVPCADGLCTTLARTRDGGDTWRRVPAPPLALPATIQIDPVLSGCNQIVCVSHVAFATPKIGYVSNGWQLFMTTDAGTTWQEQAGAGAALAIGSATVWRSIDQNRSECAQACRLHVQSSAIGTSTWQDLTLPSGVDSGTGIDLARRDTHAALVIYIGTGSSLITTTDDGATWAVRGNVCPQGHGAMDMLSPVIAADQSATLLCRPAGAPGTGLLTVTSSDGGATFHPSATFGPASGYVAGAASAQVLFADTDRLYRSADAGATWQPVSLGAVARPQAFVIRFTTATTGIVLVRDAAGAVSPTIWATTDAGSTWHAQTFP